MGRSQHKETLRACPVCQQEKMYPERSRVCSAECETQRRRGNAATNKPSNHAAEKPSETRDETENELTLSLNKTRIKTLAQLLEACEVDTRTWECYRFVANKWDMGWVERSPSGDRADALPLYQVKAWFRKKVEIVNVTAELASLKADSIRNTKPVRFPALSQSLSRTMLELSIPDLHMGKLAWAKETGWEDYDSTIAAKCFTDALDSLLSRSNAHRYREIVLVVGNDLLNSDNKSHTTTRGTPQTSTDTRYQKTFADTRRLISAAIRRCRDLAAVRVVMVSGNHDELSLWHLGDSLECEFANAEGILIDNTPTLRKYHQFGQIGLMWTHGDKGKRDNYPLLFATEQREIWGATRFHEVHTGHFHQTRVQEFNGTRVRILSALCAPDAWHSENGFVGSLRSAEAFIWEADEGLIGTSIYTVPETKR